MITSSNIKRVVYGTFGVYLVIYFLSAFLSPVDQATLAKYNLSEFGLRLLSTTILLPLVVIWACAAYGFVHFKQYALSIRGSMYGKGINTIANGLGIIALQLVVSGLVSIISKMNSFEEAVGGKGAVEIISTDITLIFALTSAILLYLGASQLNSSLVKPSKPKTPSKAFYLFAIVSLTFLLAIFLRYPTAGNTEAIYEYIPIGAAIIGVGIPYIIVWNLYLLASQHLNHYRHHVKGKVYKQALDLLNRGINIVLGSSVLIQFLSTYSEILSDLNLAPLLVIVYVLIFTIGLGFILIARAATKLSRVDSY